MRRQIIELKQQGMPATAIAEKLKCHLTSVYAALKAAKENGVKTGKAASAKRRAKPSKPVHTAVAIPAKKTSGKVKLLIGSAADIADVLRELGDG